jgi:hypothetical protein
MGIHHGGVHLVVPEEFLHRPDIIALLADYAIFGPSRSRQMAWLALTTDRVFATL